MHESDSDKISLKFWIAALAFSMLLLAVTFALMAIYLADIKSNTQSAWTRGDFVMERLNILDLEVAEIHRHMLAEKTLAAPSTAASGIEVPIANPAAPPLPSANPELPPIQTPTLAEPAKEGAASTPPASAAPPAPASAAPLVMPPAAKPH